MPNLSVRGNRSMTYISAFRCQGGIVMSADTQESWGDYKNYVEKLSIVEDRSYPLAIGGAGVADLIEPMTQEVIERSIEAKPATAAELRRLLREVVATVYREDLPWLVTRKQERTPEFLIAAKPLEEECCIFRIKGKRLYSIKNVSAIGYGTPTDYVLLERMYRPDLPMQQAVMLAIYLVSLSKKTAEGVGGDTSIAVISDNGAWIDDPIYIKKFETFIGDFLRLIDRLFLNCVDVSIPPESAFPEKLEKFGEDVKRLRTVALNYSAARALQQANDDPNFPGYPYPKIFPGATSVIMEDGSVIVKEDAPELIRARSEVFAAFSSNPQNDEDIRNALSKYQEIEAKYRVPGERGRQWRGEPMPLNPERSKGQQ